MSRSYVHLQALFLQTNDNPFAVFLTCFGVPLFVLALVIYFSWKKMRDADNEAAKERVALLRMSPKEKEEYLAKKKDKERSEKYGYVSPRMICPHCHEKNCVRTRKIIQKKGISGAKATGAVLTGGVSVLATGLSRKEDATAARCDNCNNNWTF
jgi:hypothetical protein